ncbi:helix-turn-helix domain-containing protein [Oxalobacter aliiformigenes]|uniref:helix-turn-helix domain-containing protein n=2 Tax=Oxalobacter aliiformigenes TaxID=2946593 RepID=UPI0039FCFD1E
MMKTLTAEEVGKILKLTRTSVTVKAKAGEIPGMKIGNRWIFLEVDLLAYIRSQYKCAQGGKEEKICRSTNVRIRPTGGSKSRHQVESEYNRVLGLKTD